MTQHTYKGLAEDGARQLEPTGRDDLIASALTEPEAFLLWAEQHRREEGKFKVRLRAPWRRSGE